VVQEKLRKRKKVKAIKSKNRIVTKEAEVAAVQHSWQKFVTKVSGLNISQSVSQSVSEYTIR
jgi:hypothetical protein